MSPPDNQLVRKFLHNPNREPRLQAALAEIAIRENRLAEGYAAWVNLARQTPVKPETAWIFENLMAISSIADSRSIGQDVLAAGRRELNRFNFRLPFPVQYKQQTYNQLVAAFWMATPMSTDRPVVWRTLAWLLIAARDADSLQELLAKVANSCDPWVPFYQGALAALRGDWNTAAERFETAAGAGIPEGAENAALLYRAAGETERAKQLHQTAQRILKLFYPPNWLQNPQPQPAKDQL